MARNMSQHLFRPVPAEISTTINTSDARRKISKRGERRVLKMAGNHG